MNNPFIHKRADASDFAEILRYRAIHQPDQTAYIFLKDGETKENRITYQELDRQARAIASQLQSLGTPGERALLLYPPGLEYIASFFGCLYAGMIAVPLYPPHPARMERTLPRLKGIIRDANPFIALATASILPIAKLMLSRDPDFKNIQWNATDSDNSGKLSTRISNFLFSGSSGARRPCTPECKVSLHSGIAFLQYTSGSTGDPKGVMVTHENLMYNSELIRQCSEHTPESVGVSWLPPYHDMGLIGGILQPLYCGFPVVLMSPVAFLQKPLRWLRAISKYNGTTSAGPNFAFDLCVRKATPEQMENLDLSKWKMAYNGAEPVRPETLERFSAAFASCGFRKETFYPCYGLAEATLIVSGGSVKDLPVIKNFDRDALTKKQVAETGCRPVSASLIGCGKTLQDQKIIIVNPYTMIRCKPDEIGEIWVSGKSVAQGYWQNPEATREIFQAYLDDTGEGPFLRTGDLGFLSDGELFVTGRLKDLIIIRGRNHYPHDIELTTEQSYFRLRPGCCAAFHVEVDGEERLVIAAEAERRFKERRKKDASLKGEERRQSSRRKHTILPVYIPDDSGPLDMDTAFQAIRQAVSENHELQAYAVLLLKVGGIPKTSSGKIRRHACKEKFLNNTLDVLESSFLDDGEQSRTLFSGEQSSDLFSPELSAIPPENHQAALESYLKKLVSTVLKINSSQIDIRQPLSSMGIDSLMAIELHHRLETELGFAPSMTRFLEGPSIAQLATELMEKRGQEDSGVRSQQPITNSQSPIANSHYHPLSHNQQSLWFMYRLAPESPAYNLFFAVRIVSETDISTLRQAFRTLVSRHPSLRTTYAVYEDMPVQQVHEDAKVCFGQTDVSSWKEEELNHCLIREAYRPFDLEKGPIMRINLYTRSADDHILLLNIHHIATDLWSFSLMLDELRLSYEEIKAQDTGHRTHLPPAPCHQPLSYTDYVRWQAEMLASSEGERLWKYWEKQLGGELPVLNLPTDRPRPPVQTYNGASYGFRISKEVTEKIKSLARKSGATLYMTLLASFQILLHRYTGQEDILVGSPTAGRSKAEFEKIIGYFINLVIIRSDLSGNPTFRAFLETVRQGVLETLKHQDYPFQLLVERLKPERDPGRSPLCQIMFALQKPYRLEESAPFALRETGARMNLGGIELESVALEQRIAQFDMTLFMVETEGALSASLEYNTDLFDADTISRMAGHFQTLLAGIAENPEQTISELPILTQAERHQLLVEWNDTKAEFPYDKSIVSLFEEQAQKRPDNIAVVFEDNKLTHF